MRKIIFQRFCKRCNEIFKTFSKHGKICPECNLRDTQKNRINRLVER